MAPWGNTREKNPKIFLHRHTQHPLLRGGGKVFWGKLAERVGSGFKTRPVDPASFYGRGLKKNGQSSEIGPRRTSPHHRGEKKKEGAKAATTETCSRGRGKERHQKKSKKELHRLNADEPTSPLVEETHGMDSEKEADVANPETSRLVGVLLNETQREREKQEPTVNYSPIGC